MSVSKAETLLQQDAATRLRDQTRLLLVQRTPRAVAMLQRAATLGKTAEPSGRLAG